MCTNWPVYFLLCEFYFSYLFNLQLNEVSSVFDGTLVYNVTPAMILTEWHRLYSTALQFSDSVKEVVELVQGKLFSQIPHNSTVDWSEILLNRLGKVLW